MTRLPSSREECRAGRPGRRRISQQYQYQYACISSESLKEGRGLFRLVLDLCEKGGDKRKGMNEWLLGYRNKDKVVKS